MSGFRTPDRFRGTREEEKIRFENKPGTEPDPTDDGCVLFRDGEFVFRDNLGIFNPRGGLSEAEHEELDTLTHELVEDSFDEVLYAFRQPVNITTYTDATKTTKIREVQVTYTFRQPTEVITIQYDASGIELYRVTETITYAARQVSTITRVRTP